MSSPQEYIAGKGLELSGRDLSTPVDVYAIAKQEIDEIVTFIPPKGIPVEDRTKLNAVIRARLPLASDLAVAQLMINGHDLSRREFLSRLREQRMMQMEAPFVFMEAVSSYSVGRDKLFDLAHQTAVRRAVTTSVDRVVDAFNRYEQSPMGRDDRVVFADILNSHPEADEIVRLYLERNGNRAWHAYWIEDIKKLAEKRRDLEITPKD